MNLKKQYFDKPFPLYHLSESSHDGETFVPRPMDKDRVMEGENWRAKRICVSSSIDGALSALVDSISMPAGMILHVYEILNLNDLFKRGKVYKPSILQVPDCETTNEYWIRDKAVLKCIGAIEVGHVKDKPLFYMWQGEKTRMDRFHWRWVDKPDLTKI